MRENHYIFVIPDDPDNTPRCYRCANRMALVSTATIAGVTVRRYECVTHVGLAEFRSPDNPQATKGESNHV